MEWDLYFPVLFDKDSFGASRDDIFDTLKTHGIGARKYFYPITTAMECYRKLYDPESTPVALSTSKKVLTLPIYADLDMSDVDLICDIILGFSA